MARPGFTSRRPRKRRFLDSRISYYVFRMQTVWLHKEGDACWMMGWAGTQSGNERRSFRYVHCHWGWVVEVSNRSKRLTPLKWITEAKAVM